MRLQLETNLFSAVYVVTDSEIISNEIKSHGGNVIMSQKSMNQGVIELRKLYKHVDCDLVVNVQGDEPFTETYEFTKSFKCF